MPAVLWYHTAPGLAALCRDTVFCEDALWWCWRVIDSILLTKLLLSKSVEENPGSSLQEMWCNTVGLTQVK